MKKIIYVLGIVLSVLSCSNDENSNDINQNSTRDNSDRLISLDDYYEFIKVNSHDKILVQHTKFINSNDAIQSLSAIRNSSSNPYILKLNGSEFIPNYIYNSQSLSTYNLNDTQLSNIYGKKLKLDFFKDINLTLDTSENYNIYIPNILEVSVSNLSPEGEIKVGTKITWNADNLNTNGITLLSEYSPSTQSDASIANNYPNILVGGKTILDNGSYVIQSEDLDGLPKGARVKFTLGRAGFTITNNGDINKDISFGAYTMVKGEYIIN